MSCVGSAHRCQTWSLGGHLAAASLLLPSPGRQEERPPYHRAKKSSAGGVCYLSMGVVVLLMGLAFASVYIYRYFFLAQLARDSFFHCGVLYEDSLSSQTRTRDGAGGGRENLPRGQLRAHQRPRAPVWRRRRRRHHPRLPAGPHRLPRHLSGQVLRHRAQHHYRAAPSQLLGAPHERKGGGRGGGPQRGLILPSPAPMESWPGVDGEDAPPPALGVGKASVGTLSEGGRGGVWACAGRPRVLSRRRAAPRRGGPTSRRRTSSRRKWW
uniref:Integral membrane protein 2 n=1 Tax=Oryctolagus cuniculus TaxID=9986 RepID=A0A5F9CXD4_RABIT